MWGITPKEEKKHTPFDEALETALKETNKFSLIIKLLVRLLNEKKEIKLSIATLTAAISTLNTNVTAYEAAVATALANIPNTDAAEAAVDAINTNIVAATAALATPAPAATPAA